MMESYLEYGSITHGRTSERDGGGQPKGRRACGRMLRQREPNAVGSFGGGRVWITVRSVG
jgi:hypothetical protein